MSRPAERVTQGAACGFCDRPTRLSEHGPYEECDNCHAFQGSVSRLLSRVLVRHAACDCVYLRREDLRAFDLLEPDGVRRVGVVHLDCRGIVGDVA
jgi:hypothetical protein